ncbi:hypothetical protein TWF970_010861 [Orbilia oligospora]|uniref:Uncharacterized protein n=1 Tax=Orbilia oligospora TaxID=2813651 RepID=A0A7C8R1Z6_ORBOL|nr:hypothetical protein TWF970_010861 [Orbilia oligospora]
MRDFLGFFAPAPAPWATLRLGTRKEAVDLENYLLFIYYILQGILTGILSTFVLNNTLNAPRLLSYFGSVSFLLGASAIFGKNATTHWVLGIWGTMVSALIPAIAWNIYYYGKQSSFCKVLDRAEPGKTAAK